MTVLEWIRDALRGHPELGLFLTMAAGYWIGNLRIRSFRLGSVIGCLLAGITVGQIGIVIPNELRITFFLLFLFSVGYETGPQFFRSLGRSAIPQVILPLLFNATGFLMVYVIVTALRFDAGTSLGLFAGALVSSEALGAGTDAIQRLAVGDEVRSALLSNTTVAYTLMVVVATFETLFLLVRLGPWLMRVDLRVECKKLEDELGMKKEEIGVVSAYKQFVMRAYRVPREMNGKSVAEVENTFSPERVFVERVRSAEQIVDAEPELRLHAGELLVLSGRPSVLGGAGNPLRVDEVEEPELLDVPAIAVDHVLQRKDLTHRTLEEIAEALEREVPTRGVYLRKVRRAGQEIPLGTNVVLERGDVLTLIGAKRHVDRVAERLGPVERASHATDLVWLCLAIGIGGLIGLPAVRAAGINIAIGLPVGVLLASLVVGWRHSIHPSFARVPDEVLWFLGNVGLNAFLAAIGINGALSFVTGFRSVGPVLLVAGLFVCVVPYAIVLLVGRYVFRLHPGILLGICSGCGTNSMGLAAVQEKAESRVPVLGYSVSYAVSAVLLALCGSLIVAMVNLSTGR